MSLDSLAQTIRENILMLAEGSSDETFNVDSLSSLVRGGLRGVTGLHQGLQEDMTGFEDQQGPPNTVPNAVEAGP